MLLSMVGWRIPFIVVLLPLVSCAPEIPALPADEVLQKAVTAAQSLTSAAYTAKADFAFSGGTFGDGGGRLDIRGSINEGGRVVGGTVNASMHFRDSDTQDRTIRAELDTVSVESQRFYMLIRSLTSTPDGGIFDPASLKNILGIWWEFSPTDTGAGIAVSPSPRLLQAQASVVQVTRDLGREEIDGIPAYHYAVALDPDRFFAYAQALALERGEEIDEEALRAQIVSLQATGELWISAEHFHVIAIQWEIPSLRLPGGSLLRVDFTASLSQHGSAPMVEIPTGSQPFPNTATILPGGDPLDVSLPDDLSESELRSAVDDYVDTAIFPPIE